MRDWVTLNVGGTRFETRLSTLPPSLLAKVASSPTPPCTDCLDNHPMGNNVTSDMMGNNMMGNDMMGNDMMGNDDMGNSLMGSGGDKPCASCHHRAGAQYQEALCLDCDPACFAVILNCLRYSSAAVPPSLPAALVREAALALGLQEVAARVQEAAARGRALDKEARGREEWIRLNVGGQVFETSRATLTSHPDSSLARMFQPRSKLAPAIMDDGVYQLDACPRAFAVLLNWLRYRRLMLPPAVRPEEVVPVADFFGVVSLQEALQQQMEREEEKAAAVSEAADTAAERIEDALQQVQGEVSNVVDKLDDIKMEVAGVVTELENLWRIKCEVTGVVRALGGGK